MRDDGARACAQPGDKEILVRRGRESLQTVDAWANALKKTGVRMMRQPYTNYQSGQLRSDIREC